MKRREAVWLGAVGVATAAGGFLFGASRLTADPSRELAAATFDDMDGRPRRVSEWTGLVVVCNFWASWCAPCREEIPMLVDIRREYAAKGVEVVGIALDSRANIAEFVKSYPMPYPVLVGGVDGVELLRRLGNRQGALPFTVILDQQGKVAGTRLGEMTRAQVQGLLEPLLS